MLHYVYNICSQRQKGEKPQMTQNHSQNVDTHTTTIQFVDDAHF